jgi:hypothetical protein
VNYIAGGTLARFNTTSLDACMDKCASYNTVVGGGCLVAEFQANLTTAETSQGGDANCFLISNLVVPTSDDTHTLAGAVITLQT